VELTWREARLDKAKGGFGLVKGKPDKQSYVLQVVNSNKKYSLKKVTVSVKSPQGETEGFPVKKILPERYIELGKLETNGRGFFPNDIITVTASGYAQSKVITLQVPDGSEDIQEPPPVEITWREARIDKAKGGFALIKGKPDKQSYVLQVTNSDKNTTLEKLTILVKSPQGDTERFVIALKPEGYCELGKLETKGRGFFAGDIITVTASGYAQSKVVTLQLKKEDNQEDKNPENENKKDENKAELTTDRQN
jgi:hypothetical protein